jgi:hypothetical protein
MKHGCIPKQALAAPVQEPVLWLVNGVVQVSDIPADYTGCLYTTPPAAQRQWVGLTDDEMYLNCPNWLSHEQSKTWVQQIEAKLKEKNT